MSYDDICDETGDLCFDGPRRGLDIIDAFAPLEIRARGALMGFLCDARGGLVLPIAIEEIDPDLDGFEQADLVWKLVETCRATGLGGLALAVCRPGGEHPDSHDLAWAEFLHEACRHHEVNDLGAHLATLDAVVPLPSSTAGGRE